MAASTRSKYINKKPEATLATTVQAHPTEAAYHLTPSLTSAVRQSWIPSAKPGQPSVGNRPHARDLGYQYLLLLSPCLWASCRVPVSSELCSSRIIAMALLAASKRGDTVLVVIPIPALRGGLRVLVRKTTIS